jgi:CBS domain-containing protein
VKEAAAKIKETGLSRLIVERRNENDSYGMISVRDIVYKVAAKGLDPENVYVYEIMTKPCITASPNLDVKYAARLMAQVGINRALVIAEHKLLGILSVLDILKTM